MSNFKKYRIIGDIHGRLNWADLVTPFDKDIQYVFVGDFTDPYYYDERIGYNQMLEQMKLVFAFWREHKDNVIILASNHDLQYILLNGETNRYDTFHAFTINSVFRENQEAISKAVFQIGEKYLISHAGVTLDWYEKWFGKKKENLTLQEICDQINKLWSNNKQAFLFSTNVTKMSDYYGDSATHSPVWVRPLSLWEHNIFGFGSGKIQIIGHTRFDHYDDKYKDLLGHIVATGTEKVPLTEDDLKYGKNYWINDGENKCSPKYNDNENPDMIQIDCLATETACIEINGDTLDWSYKLKDK